MDVEIDIDGSRLLKDTNTSSHLTTTTTTTPIQHIPKEPLLDANTEYISNILLYVALCVLIGAFGTVANIINIIVYVRMGIFNMASNLNLFSLAVSDLGVSVTTFLHGAGFAVIVMDIKDLPFDAFGVVYVTVGFPLIIFTIITRILTAYVALERCLCVVLPFRIRTMFSINRCAFYITIIYLYTIVSHIPLFVVHPLVIEKQPITNLSKLIVMHTNTRDDVYLTVHYLNNLTVTMTTIAVIIVCTITTTGRIKTSKAWRKSVSGFSSGGGGGGSSSSTDPKSTQTQTQKDEKSFATTNNKAEENSGGSKNKKMSDEAIDREMRLVRMITTMSLIYLVCYIPDFLIIVMRAINDEIQFKGAYYRLAQLTYGLALIGCAVNSSVNVFIYYRMSTRFRHEFLTLFGFGETKDKPYR